MTVSTKAAISTPENHKPLEALDIIDRLIHSLLRAYAPKYYTIHERCPDFASPQTTYRGTGFFQIQFTFGRRRTISIFYDCDCDYTNISPTGAIGVSLGDSGLSRPLIQSIATVLSVFGPAYYQPCDSIGEYEPLNAPQASILGLMQAGLIRPCAYNLYKWANYWKTNLAHTPNARPLHEFLGVQADTPALLSEDEAAFTQLMNDHPSTLPATLQTLFAECAAIALTTEVSASETETVAVKI